MRLITAMLAATVLVAATVFSRECRFLARAGTAELCRARAANCLRHVAACNASPGYTGATGRHSSLAQLCVAFLTSFCRDCILVVRPQPYPSLPWQRRSQCEPRGSAAVPAAFPPPRPPCQEPLRFRGIASGCYVPWPAFRAGQPCGGTGAGACLWPDVPRPSQQKEAHSASHRGRLLGLANWAAAAPTSSPS